MYQQECKSCLKPGFIHFYEDEIERVSNLFGNHLERRIFKNNAIKLILKYLNLPDVYLEIFKEEHITIEDLISINRERDQRIPSFLSKMEKYESNELSLDDFTRILDRVKELYRDHNEDVKESVDNEIPHETALCEAC